MRMVCFLNNMDVVAALYSMHHYAATTIDWLNSAIVEAETILI